jgi:hypothetical protein
VSANLGQWQFPKPAAARDRFFEEVLVDLASAESPGSQEGDRSELGAVASYVLRPRLFFAPRRLVAETLVVTMPVSSRSTPQIRRARLRCSACPTLRTGQRRSSLQRGHVCRYRFIPHIATVATLALFGVFDYQRLKSFIVKALKHLAQTYTSSKDDQPSFLLLEPLIFDESHAHPPSRD